MQPSRRQFLLAGAGLPSAAPKTVRLEHRIFPGFHYLDGNWAALLAASDGKVYTSFSHHGGDGRFLCYDSKSGRRPASRLRVPARSATRPTGWRY